MKCFLRTRAWEERWTISERASIAILALDQGLAQGFKLTPYSSVTDPYLLAERTPRMSSKVPRQQSAHKSLARYEREAPSRNTAIEATYANGAYTLKTIGEHFGLRYATISRGRSPQDVAKYDLTLLRIA